MVDTVLEYYKGSTRGNVTVTNLVNDKKNSSYDASWADTSNTTVVVVDESDIDTAIVTISDSDIVSVGSSTIVFKKSALSTLNRGNYVLKIIPSDGTDTDNGRAELRVI